MKYGTCLLSVIPCRLEPADSSEMVTQILFGEHYKILEERSKWSRIRLAYDKYECWIDKKQVSEISKETYETLDKQAITASTDLVSVVLNESNKGAIPILLGSSLPGYNKGKVTVEESSFLYEGPATTSEPENKRSAVVEHSLMLLEAPYLWGGRSPFGIDCSGFTQLVYKLIGFKLPRDAYQQAEIGQTLSFVEEAEEGDLAFFDNEEGRIIHVGLLLKDNHIIHASGKVRIDRIDHQGIYNSDTRSYSHKLRLIKRILK